MRRLAGNSSKILKIWLNRGGKWLRLLRERSPKRQQPFSAPLPAKGETLLDLSGSDLSKMQCAIVESFVFPLIIFLPKHYLKKKELFWTIQDGACLQKMHCALCTGTLCTVIVLKFCFSNLYNINHGGKGAPRPFQIQSSFNSSDVYVTYILMLVTWL